MGNEKDNKFELLQFYQRQGADLWAAREKAKLIHKARDVKSSGNEVEIAVRKVLAKLLPQSYRIGHGHIIDKNSNISPQLDIIVSESANSTLLYKAEDGTEFITYETVYAIGEIKTSYKKSDKPIHAFKDTIKKINSFEREKTLPNEFGDLRLGANLSASDSRPYKNPLFKFMIFIDCEGDFEEDVNKLDAYIDDNLENIPNAIFFMNKGSILNYVYNSEKNTVGTINVIPEFHLNVQRKWCFRKPFRDEFSLGCVLFTLIAVLSDHCKFCVLKKPNLIEYARNVDIFDNKILIMPE